MIVAVPPAEFRFDRRIAGVFQMVVFLKRKKNQKSTSLERRILWIFNAAFFLRLVFFTLRHQALYAAHFSAAVSGLRLGNRRVKRKRLIEAFPGEGCRVLFNCSFSFDNSFPRAIKK